MTEEDLSAVLPRYRSTVTDEPTPHLDELILRAAGRHSVRVRVMRRCVVALALAALVTWPSWHLHGIRLQQARDMSGYGRQEGLTRYYLLNVASVQYTGPGSRESGQ
ncbi:MAG: hypothetical protein ACRD6W_15515 [Nitrososphaerales archaeon]